MKMIDHNHFICHLILGTFTEYPFIGNKTGTFLLLQQKGSCFYGDIYPVVL